MHNIYFRRNAATPVFFRLKKERNKKAGKPINGERGKMCERKRKREKKRKERNRAERECEVERKTIAIVEHSLNCPRFTM